jgi:hypothetical protein
MHASLPSPALAALGESFEIGRPLFGHVGLALLAVLAGVAVLLGAVALLGRWLATTHPEPAPSLPAATRAPERFRPPEMGPEVAGEVAPIVLAAVAQLWGEAARVVSIRRIATPAPQSVPSVEALMQQWSYEGRRQIYTSHKVR